LFEIRPHAPLAEADAAATLDEVVGQQHLLGPGKPLRLAFESKTPHSMILWGPPGVGKTTLARLMAEAFDAEFIALSAVFSGVKDIREAVQRAELTLAQTAATPSSSWTRCTASTRRSRTPSCPMSSRALSPSSAPPPRTRPSR
jgi:replication-associated recombination protein RarA